MAKEPWGLHLASEQSLGPPETAVIAVLKSVHASK